MYIVELDKAALDALHKPVKGSGGFQDFMKKLQRQQKYIEQKHVLEYNDDDLEKIQQHAKYCDGRWF